MSKKTSLPVIYMIGMLVTAIGFCLPIFRLSVFGKSLASMNGFDFIGKGDSPMKIAALLVFAGAVLGVVIGLIQNKLLFKALALAISVGAGLYMFFNTADLGISIAKNFIYIGFYAIIAGWIIACAGLVIRK